MHAHVKKEKIFFLHVCPSYVGMCSKHLLHHPRAWYVVIGTRQANPVHFSEINDGNIGEGKRICKNTSLTSCIRRARYAVEKWMNYRDVYRKQTIDTIGQTVTITIMCRHHCCVCFHKHYSILSWWIEDKIRTLSRIYVSTCIIDWTHVIVCKKSERRGACSIRSASGRSPASRRETKTEMCRHAGEYTPIFF